MWFYIVDSYMKYRSIIFIFIIWNVWIYFVNKKNFFCINFYFNYVYNEKGIDDFNLFIVCFFVINIFVIVVNLYKRVGWLVLDCSYFFFIVKRYRKIYKVKIYEFFFCY